ncbi:MAG: nicotinate (nicotinamide) nucleotide adenylyltransferase [Chlorobiaceae bacterium]
MHLAVFGATFDPPHNGHLALCLFARELLQIDRLIVSVSNNPLKQKRAAADVHRMRMAELLSREINMTGACSEVSSWELEKMQPSYTVDLLRYLRDLYPTDRLTLLVGEDSFREFSLWKESEQLYALCDIVVFGRATAEQSAQPHQAMERCGAVRFIHFDCWLSSTLIRDLLAAGLSVSRHVPSSVLQYIKEHGLYLKPITSTQGQTRQGS